MGFWSFVCILKSECAACVFYDSIDLFNMHSRNCPLYFDWPFVGQFWDFDYFYKDSSNVMTKLKSS